MRIDLSNLTTVGHSFHQVFITSIKCITVRALERGTRSYHSIQASACSTNNSLIFASVGIRFATTSTLLRPLRQKAGRSNIGRVCHAPSCQQPFSGRDFSSSLSTEKEKVSSNPRTMYEALPQDISKDAVLISSSVESAEAFKTKLSAALAPHDPPPILLATTVLKTELESLSDEVTARLPDPSNPNHFRLEKFFPLLDTKTFGRDFVYTRHLLSTQVAAEKYFLDTDDGFVCYTDEQTAGKGRGNNIWTSPAGALTFSFKVKSHNGSRLPFMQYLVSLALVKCVVEKLDYKTADVRIKWPNDIYAKGLKIAGILCQSTYKDNVFDVVTGIGFNIGNEQPTTCLNAVVREATGNSSETVSREVFLAEFFNLFEGMHRQFESEGFEPFHDEYILYWLHSDQKVSVQDDKSGQQVPVVIKGIAASGGLLAVGEDDYKYELYPDGNRLDFFNGLIRRKLE